VRARFDRRSVGWSFAALGSANLEQLSLLRRTENASSWQIAATLDDPSEMKDEIRSLFAAITSVSAK
jgi:hypothetical protein